MGPQHTIIDRPRMRRGGKASSKTRTPAREPGGEAGDLAFIVTLAAGAAIAASILTLPVTMPGPMVDPAFAPAAPQRPRLDEDRRRTAAEAHICVPRDQLGLAEVRPPATDAPASVQLTSLDADRIGRHSPAPGRTQTAEDHQ